MYFQIPSQIILVLNLKFYYYDSILIIQTKANQINGKILTIIMIIKKDEDILKYKYRKNLFYRSYP